MARLYTISSLHKELFPFLALLISLAIYEIFKTLRLRMRLGSAEGLWEAVTLGGGWLKWLGNILIIEQRHT
jgi:hypothetical protein